MIEKYIEAAIENAVYKKMDDESWFADIPGFQGVWATGHSVEACRRELIEVIEEWIFLKIRDRDSLPVIQGIDINIKETVAA